MPTGIFPRKSIQERFWSNVNITDFFLCWNWGGYRDNKGYGRLGIKGRLIYAHRLSYTLNIGEIPKGLCVCHKCNNTSCCNPYHLYAGTPKDNSDDMIRANRQEHRSGENHPHAKLTETQVLEIIKLLKTDMTHKEISDRFPVTRKNITRINTGRTWKHIPR
jgi:hypothetical protein